MTKADSGFRAARKALGLTQAELAERLGVDERTVRRTEARAEILPLWAFALDGLGAQLWAESLGRIAGLTLELAQRRENAKALRPLRRRGPT